MHTAVVFTIFLIEKLEFKARNIDLILFSATDKGWSIINLLALKMNRKDRRRPRCTMPSRCREVI